MNNDLISREALKEAFKAWKAMDDYYHDTDCNDIPFSEAFDLIDNAPTLEYPFYQEAYQTGYEEGKNEKPQGEWDKRHTELLKYFVKCEKCGEEIMTSHKNYCPNCGAYMRGDT